MSTSFRSSTRVRCSGCANNGEWKSFMRCSRCKFAVYCSNDCQTSDWPYHKTQCSPASPKDSLSYGSPVSTRQRTPSVRGVSIACNADRARGARIFEVKILDPSHPIHTQGGIICPLFQQVGFPLVLYRHHTEDPLTMLRDPGLDNQVAMHLLTHPGTGHPEERWRRAGCLGTVIVLRQDGKPLTLEAVETVLMYADYVLGLFGDGVSPSSLLNPAGFQRFCQKYKNQRVSGGHSNFYTMALPF
ncbi:hypothetical protein PAXRUDRAFT_828606 [Paxillus rubicundulus Ve08.2h10]|uniref:MYND-type domain-containing protein n=1 Tax=Paxillus rubicundulus Ve08.2h10 TaxID=930991 RepID=A0A0D0E129_9AGAM|nr:hypothetical protein PAXRUDRAFT_828606 [Paxillus rubicundulus Ve08.2h10]